jgi:hypothetical protein
MPASHEQRGAASRHREERDEPRTRANLPARQSPRRDEHGRQAERDERRDRCTNAGDALEPREHVARHHHTRQRE